MDLLRRHPFLAALAGIAALLAVVLMAELGSGAGDRTRIAASAPPRVAASPAKLLPPVPATVPERAYPETGARPLFTPTRRPAPAVAATPAAQMAKGQFTLQGVMIAGAQRTAFLREKSSGKIHRVDKGRQVKGITVAEVEAEKVTLAQDGEKEELALLVHRAGAPGSTVPPPQVAGPFAAPERSAAAPGAPVAPPPEPPVSQPLPGRVPQAATQPQPQPAPGGTAQPAAPMTPEELLARRRARRAQRNQ